MLDVSDFVGLKAVMMADFCPWEKAIVLLDLILSEGVGVGSVLSLVDWDCEFFKEMLLGSCAVCWIYDCTHSVQSWVHALEVAHADSRTIKKETDSSEFAVKTVGSFNGVALIKGKAEPVGGAPPVELEVDVFEHGEVLRGALLHSDGLVSPGSVHDGGPFEIVDIDRDIERCAVEGHAWVTRKVVNGEHKWLILFVILIGGDCGGWW